MSGLILLLINAAIVLLPFSMLKYYRRYHQITGVKNDVLIGIVSSVTIILCMTVPFEILPGYLFDLRTIPFLMGIFYGGYIGGAFSTFSLYLYRFYLGGSGMWNVWIVYSIILVLAYLIVPIYKGGSKERKKWIGTGLAFLTASLMLVNTAFREGLPSSEWVSILVYYFLHGIITWIAVDFLEGSRTHLMRSWESSRIEIRSEQKAEDFIKESWFEDSKIESRQESFTIGKPCETHIHPLRGDHVYRS